MDVFVYVYGALVALVVFGIVNKKHMLIQGSGWLVLCGFGDWDSSDSVLANLEDDPIGREVNLQIWFACCRLAINMQEKLINRPEWRRPPPRRYRVRGF